MVARGAGAERFDEGDRVMAVVGGGGQAELVLVHERAAMPVPEALDWPAAGGVPEVFVTAHDALFSQAGLRPGERLLVHGGAGGVGTGSHPARPRGRRSRSAATVQRKGSGTRSSRSLPKAIDPGFADQGPFDVVLELIGAPNIPATSRRSPLRAASS